MPDQKRAGGGWSPILRLTHQDEFPTVYSLAGCSPAEPAAASTAAIIFNLNPRLANQNTASGNCPRQPLSQITTHATRQSPSAPRSARSAEIDSMFGSRFTPPR